MIQYTRTKSHLMKFTKIRFRTEKRKHLFFYKMQNSLPGDILVTFNLDGIKRGLDKFIKDKSAKAILKN